MTDGWLMIADGWWVQAISSLKPASTWAIVAL